VRRTLPRAIFRPCFIMQQTLTMQQTPASQPWQLGAQPVYTNNDASNGAPLFSVPESNPNIAYNCAERMQYLHEWGRRRESELHRAPKWCMDQLISGSGWFPPRHLAAEWFTPQEQQQIRRLERVLASTRCGEILARDVMALKIYNVDIRIIVDDSGSMNRSMFGDGNTQGWTRYEIERIFGKRAFKPDNASVFQGCPLGPCQARWAFARHAVSQWEQVFQELDVRPTYYKLNRSTTLSTASEVFQTGPRGGTPMGSTFRRVLRDIIAADPKKRQTHLILALTDGEANDKNDFNRVLDEIQDGNWGDVQVCLMGLSLEPEDIEWFEDEECDDTRIRTIEPWEVEQQQILWRQVIGAPRDYTFSMHTMRALVTNLFPADYDCEAPLQTLRHRLYITLHAADRRATGLRDTRYATLDSCDCFAGLFRKSRRKMPIDEELETELNDERFARLFQRRMSRYDATLGHIQNAIGCLQPGELESRDLKFGNSSRNSKAVGRALRHLYRAVGMEAPW